MATDRPPSAPRDRSRQLILTTCLMVALATAFVATRLLFKIFVKKIAFGNDDWLSLAALVSITPSAFLLIYGLAANGLGRDIWTLEPQEITNALMYFHISACLYFVDTALVKLSIICFYLRIFPARTTRRWLLGTFICTVVWTAAFILITVFQCWPVSYFWTQWDGTQSGSCLDANAIAWSHASINIALDIWILAVPLWQLRALQLHWRKKLAVALMFCVGTA